MSVVTLKFDSAHAAPPRMSSQVRPTAPPTALQAKTFEEQKAAFASDDRIHFSKASGTWQYEADDGAEMEWDASKGAWVPLVSNSCSFLSNTC